MLLESEIEHQARKFCGIYQITNSLNHKVYIGSAKYLHLRYLNHRTNLKHNKHTSIHLQRYYNKHRDAKFTIKVLEFCNKEERIARENFWIKLKKAADDEFGFNMCPIAGKTTDLPRSEEAILKSKTTLINGPYNTYKKILLINEEGFILQVFDGVREAAKALNLQNSGIVRACQGYITHTGGYLFRYYDDLDFSE